MWTGADAGRFDLVVGNPPFGRDTVSTLAEAWAARNGWPIAYGDIGTLFIAKAGSLAREGGQIAFIQSAPALLYNTTGTAQDIRRLVFSGAFRVEGVTVLPPRLRLFKNVKMPACVVVLHNTLADGEPFMYECLKRQWTARVELDDKIRFVHDPDGAHWLTPHEVLEEPWVWAALAWGGARDRALIRRLQKYPSLNELESEGNIKSRQGLNRGNKQRRQGELAGYRYLPGVEFPRETSLSIDGRTLPHVDDVRIDRDASTDLRAFTLPQLLIKSSWTQAAAGFEARRVVGEAAIAEKAFLSVSGPAEILDATAVAFNSHVATYFLLLTSGRLAFDRSEPLVRDLRGIPVPPASRLDLSALRSEQDVHELAFELFGLTDAERILVEDLIEYTLDDFKGDKSNQPGRRPTQRGDGQEPHLSAYGEAFASVLSAAYGDDGRVQMDVLSEEGQPVPVRLVRFVVGPAVEARMAVRHVPGPEIRRRLAAAYRESRLASEGTFRIARAYETVDAANKPHLAVTLIKPDEVRYWTRSTGIRDADRFVADVTLWAAGRLNGGLVESEFARG